MKYSLKQTSKIGRGDFILSGDDVFRVIAGPADGKVVESVQEYRDAAPHVHAHQDILHLHSIHGVTRHQFFAKTNEFYVINGPMAYAFWATELIGHKMNKIIDKITNFVYN